MSAFVGHGRTATLVALLHWEAHNTTPPSITELARSTGSNRTTVYAHLCRLRKSGLVDWEPGCERTLHSTVAIVVPRGVTFEETNQ